ncbi:MAG: hypothetical protein FJ098_15345, partial [Deltaproteobacteria bacterium]|nr:hypothetical protein [Deltaproteobacteria bacterium]
MRPALALTLLLLLTACAGEPAGPAGSDTGDGAGPGDVGGGDPQDGAGDLLPGDAPADGGPGDAPLPDAATDRWTAGDSAPELCVPDCTGRACGGDGCGGSCGECGLHQGCVEGACVEQPWCGDGACDAATPEGPEDCGTCPGDCPCGGKDVCWQGACCTPVTCVGSGLVCGSWPDGCGGTVKCGTCVTYPGSFCTPEGQCACIPSCAGKECGGDGCGG